MKHYLLTQAAINGSRFEENNRKIAPYRMHRNLHLLFAFLLLSFAGFGQVRIVTVIPDQDEITLQNFGTATEDISDWRLCSEFRYTGSGIDDGTTVLEGSLNLEPGATVTVTGFELNDVDADLGLYAAAGAFSDPAALLDYMQYGDSDNARETVAVQANLWEAGAFIEGNAPFNYTGDGAQNGIEFWEDTVIEEDAIIRLLTLDTEE